MGISSVREMGESGTGEDMFLQLRRREGCTIANDVPTVRSSGGDAINACAHAVSASAKNACDLRDAQGMGSYAH
jgi:hypothetical protein